MGGPPERREREGNTRSRRSRHSGRNRLRKGTGAVVEWGEEPIKTKKGGKKHRCGVEKKGTLGKKEDKGKKMKRMALKRGWDCTGAMRNKDLLGRWSIQLKGGQNRAQKTGRRRKGERRRGVRRALEKEVCAARQFKSNSAPKPALNLNWTSDKTKENRGEQRMFMQAEDMGPQANEAGNTNFQCECTKRER